MVTLEMFVQRHDGSAMGAFQVPHCRIPTSSGDTNHTLIVIMEEEFLALCQ